MSGYADMVEEYYEQETDEMVDMYIARQEQDAMLADVRIEAEAAARHSVGDHEDPSEAVFQEVTAAVNEALGPVAIFESLNPETKFVLAKLWLPQHMAMDTLEDAAGLSDAFKDYIGTLYNRNIMILRLDNYVGTIRRAGKMGAHPSSTNGWSYSIRTDDYDPFVPDRGGSIHHGDVYAERESVVTACCQHLEELTGRVILSEEKS